MEHAESTGQESKKRFNLGGKKKVIFICLGAFLVFNVAARGVGFRGSMAYGGRNLAARSSIIMGTGDTSLRTNSFEPLGIIFAEANATGRNGYGTVHEALMKEAAAKGADAIINVNIAPTSGVFNRTWSGSALAIRY